MAVNQWASKSLPTVEQHLQRAEQIHASLGKTTPGANTDRSSGQNNSGTKPGY